MKRAWKIALGLATILATCVAVLWIDSYYRAVAAIKAEDERLAKDIAAYRAGKKPGLGIEREQFRLGWYEDGVRVEVRRRPLPCPMSIFMSKKRAQIEEGQSGHSDFYYTLLRDYGPQSLGSVSRYTHPPLAGDQVIDALSVTHHLAQECGYDSRSLLYTFEIQALHTLKETLADSPAPAELRRIGEQLDRCLDGRPSFADAFNAEHLMDRAEVLRVLHVKQNASGFIRRKPGWKEFFSWRILLVKCLKELDDEYSSKIQTEFRDRLTTSALLREWDVRDREDNEVLCWWSLARTAVAIALYRAERGEPDSLKDLVPSYLPRVAQGLTLLNGNLSLPLTQDQVCTWDVRRK